METRVANDYKVQFEDSVTLCHYPTTVFISLNDATYASQIDFTYMRRSYHFYVTKWSGRGLQNFLVHFFNAAPRDPKVFGVMDEFGEYKSGADLKRNCVAEGCRDIIRCLEKILVVQQGAIIDYAIWYRERVGEPRNYSQYITKLTCHCIVHEQFMAGTVDYHVVEL
jgi:hypothetical protein